MTDSNNKVSSTLVSSLVTDVVAILMDGALENIYTTLASSLVTDATDQVSSTSESSLGLMNGALENMDVTLASSLVTNELTNSVLSTPSFFPFSHITLPFAYNCVTGCSIQVVLYHSVLYLRFLISQFPPIFFSKIYFPCEEFYFLYSKNFPVRIFSHSQFSPSQYS